MQIYEKMCKELIFQTQNYVCNEKTHFLSVKYLALNEITTKFVHALVLSTVRGMHRRVEPGL